MPSDTALEIFVNFVRDQLTELEHSVEGDIKESINAITDLIEIDCGGNWVVYVTYAFVPVLETMWLVTVPSFGEVLENYLEPKPGRRGGRRGRRGERVVRAAAGAVTRTTLNPPIPDIDEQIASRIPGAEFWKGARVGLTGFLFWTTINTVDALLWQFLLIQATQTFTTHWISGLKQSGRCQNFADASATLETATTSGFNDDPMWFDRFSLIVNFTNHMFASNNGVVTLIPTNAHANGICIVTSTHRIKTPPGLASTHTKVGHYVRIVNDQGFTQIIADELIDFTVGPDNDMTFEISSVSNFINVKSFAFFYNFQLVSGPGIDLQQASAKIAIGATEVIVE